jgi:hypothetical protein
MVNLDYAHQKFSAAVESMAESPASIQRRIADAYISQLHVLRPDDLPDEIRMEWTVTVEQLTHAESVGNEGTVMATVENMSDDDAVAIARKIVRMYDVIEARYHSKLAGD